MELLRIDKLSFSIAGKPLFTALSMSIEQDASLALIASNGAGKSTLLEHIAQNINTELGVIKTTPGLKIAYLKQNETLNDDSTVWEYARAALAEIDNLEKNIRELEKDLERPEKLIEYTQLRTRFENLDGYKAENNLKKELEAFGFFEKDYHKTLKSLSGGEKARLKLLKVLASPADLYLFDEPTNHLDIEMRHYLKKRLQKLNAAFLLVSHDRGLLEVVGAVLELNEGKLDSYKGNYNSYLKQKNQKTQSKIKQNLLNRKQAKKLKAQEQKLREIATTKVQAQRRRLQRDLDRLEPIQNKKNQRPILLKASKSKNLVLKIKNYSKSYEQKQILDNISLSLYQSDKIAFVGLNASGKTTLFKMIAGLIESDNPKRERYWAKESKLLYIDQKYRGLEAKIPIINQLTNYVTKQRAEMLLSLVKIPFENWQKSLQSLSGGEKMRLAIAIIIASEANLLLLDEPTNDLDLEMIALLEKALKDSNISIIFASHDAEFINNIATQVCSIKDAKILSYQAGLKGYYKKQLISREAFIEPELVAKEPSTQELIENYELELIQIDDNLLDPLRFSERELARLKERCFKILNELSLLYNDKQPQQLARYILKNKNIELYADKMRAGIQINSNLPITIHIIVKDSLGHLILKQDENACLLKWARNILLDLIIDLSFLYLDLNTLQFYSKENITTKFVKNSANWWVISRRKYEKLEGFIK